MTCIKFLTLQMEGEWHILTPMSVLAKQYNPSCCSVIILLIWKRISSLPQGSIRGQWKTTPTHQHFSVKLATPSPLPSFSVCAPLTLINYTFSIPLCVDGSSSLNSCTNTKKLRKRRFSNIPIRPIRNEERTDGKKTIASSHAFPRFKLPHVFYNHQRTTQKMR